MIMKIPPPASAATAAVFSTGSALEACINTTDAEADIAKRSQLTENSLRPAMNATRDAVDALERLVPTKAWPLPHYHEMLFEQD